MIKKLLLNFILLCIIVCSNAQKANIRLKLEIGKTYYQQSSTHSVVTQKINGREMPIDITVDVKAAFTVNDVKNAVYEMEVKYERLSMSMNISGQEMKFDSEKNVADSAINDMSSIFSKLMSGLKGKSFYIKMSDKGIISEVKNMDTIFSDMFAGFPQLPDGQKQQLLSQLKQAYGEKAFKGSMEMISAIFPQTVVSKGSKWIKTIHLQSAMMATANTTYQLTGISSESYQIHGNGIMQTADKGSTMQMGGNNLKYNLTGNLESDIELDIKTGWINTAKIIQKMKGDVEIKNESMPSINGKTPMTTNSETTIKGSY